MRGAHENTFENGMTSDYDVVLQPDGTYPYMKNCSLVSQDGRNFTVKDCLGNTFLLTINEPYDTVYTQTGPIPRILAMTSFPSKLVVLSTNDNSTGGYGEIGVVNYLPYGEGIRAEAIAAERNPGYIPLYHHQSLNFNYLHRIKGISFIENELTQRIYWTDNYNSPRVFNTSNPIFTTHIATGSLVVGREYMVLQGAITHNAANYGPGLVNGNVFTAANTNFTDLTAPNRPAMVIEYYPYELLDFIPEQVFGTIKFDEFSTGSVKCGSKVYYYRLTAAEGIVTSWSSGTAPIPVGTSNESSDLTSPTVAYHDWVGGGSSTVTLNSGLSVLLTISGIDTNYDFIEVACAEFDQSEFAPRQMTIVAIEAITGATMQITHTGALNLGDVTIGDLTLFPAAIERCKTLATNKNYLLQGNITERAEFDWDDATNVTISQVEYPMNVHYTADNCNLSGMVTDGFSPSANSYSATTVAGTITPFSRWLVTAGTVTYNGTNYTTGQVFVGVGGVLNSDIATISTTGTFVPCVVKNKYTTTAGAAVPDATPLVKTSDLVNDRFWDYRSAAVAANVASYWSGETYRYGILFYDLKRNPFYVKWLGDYQFKELIGGSAKTGSLLRTDQIGTTGQYMYSLNPSIARISGITLTRAQTNRISGFSIVRAERDARIITQGLLTQNVDAGGSPNVTKTGSWIPISYDAHGVYSKQYSFISPDLLCNAPLKGSVGNVGDVLEEATWLDPYDYGGGSVVRGSDFPTAMAAPSQVYTKFLTCVDDSSVRTATISFYKDVDENETVTRPSSTGEVFTNQMVVGGAGGVVKGTCVSGGLDYNLNAAQSSGGKRVLLEVETDFLHYGPSAEDYSSNAGAATALTERILMNYVNPSFGTPYGGTGETSLANTLYFSTGHFQEINASVLSATETGLGTEIYEFNDIDIGGGDCYPSLVDYGYGVYNTGFGGVMYSYAWTFPCECNANYNLRRGKKTSNVAMFYTGAADTKSIAFTSTLNRIALEDFAYNPGYSAEGQNVVYPALPINFVDSTEFQARVRWAGQKIIGEYIDTFRRFSLLDYKDISANYGRINDINVKEDKVVIWQDKAINTVPILERQVLSGATGDATTIGTGGVIDRWDVISSYFGTQHQWSITETEYGFAWFDMSKKAFVILDFGGGLAEVSQIFGLKGFFDEVFLEIEGIQAKDKTLLLNSPTFADTSDRPLTSVGIISVYDPKFKMTYMTFKFMGQNYLDLKTKDFTIGYLHMSNKKCFVGFYDMLPYFMHNHNGYVFMADNPKNTTQYLLKTGVLTNESFVVGETLWGASSYRQNEYVCIANVTLDNVAKFPEGASGTTYWAATSKVNQVWVLNMPTSLDETTAPNYVYNKFFGKVVENRIDIIINPKMSAEESFEVQNISQNGPLNVNYTDIYIEADNQTASDLNISSTNRNYRFIWNKIVSNLPLSTTGRIMNRYLKISFRKKNYTTNPTVVTTSVKILRSISSIFNTKK